MAKISAPEKKRIIARIKRRKLSPADLARRGLLNRAVTPATIPFDEVRRTLEKAGLDIKKLVEKVGLLEKPSEISKREQRAELDRLLKKTTGS